MKWQNTQTASVFQDPTAQWIQTVNLSSSELKDCCLGCLKFCLIWNNTLPVATSRRSGKARWGVESYILDDIMARLWGFHWVCEYILPSFICFSWYTMVLCYGITKYKRDPPLWSLISSILFASDWTLARSRLDSGTALGPNRHWLVGLVWLGNDPLHLIQFLYFPLQCRWAYFWLIFTASMRNECFSRSTRNDRSKLNSYLDCLFWWHLWAFDFTIHLFAI